MMTMTNDESNYDDTTNLSEMDDIDFLREVNQNMQRAREKRSRWQQEALQNYDFYAGNQWAPEDIENLKKDNRVAPVFNRIVRTINAISGLEVQNRQEVSFIARQIDPQKGMESDITTDAAHWARDNCDAEDEESEVFRDALICGEGWDETRISYDRNPQGDILIERIDPLEMYVDANAIKSNYEDAAWIARSKRLTRREIKVLWPDFDFAGVNLDQFEALIDTIPHDQDASDRYMGFDQQQRIFSDIYFVLQYQWFEYESSYTMASPDGSGNVVTMRQPQYDQIKDELTERNIYVLKSKMRVYKQAFILGNKILQRGDAPVNEFSFKCTTGLRDRNFASWFSLTSVMKDPQRWANKWLSQVQHILNTSAKSGIYAEVGAFQNISKAEQDFARPGSITQLNDGGLGKIKEKTPPGYPEGLDRLLQYAISSINDVTGVNLELLGAANKDQAVAIEMSRKQAGITILAVYFDSLRRFRKESGRLLLKFIQKYISDGRLVKVMSQAGSQYVPLLRNPNMIEYDIVVDESPFSTNMKERVFGSLMQLVPMLLQAGLPVPPDVLDYAPLPEELIQTWKQAIQQQQQAQQQQGQNPLEQIMQQVQGQLAQLSVQKSQLENTKMQQELQNNQLGQAKTQSDIGLNYAKAQQAVAISIDADANATHDAQLAGIEQHRKNLETVSTQIHQYMKTGLEHKRATDAAKASQAQQQNKPVTGSPSLAQQVPLNVPGAHVSRVVQ